MKACIAFLAALWGGSLIAVAGGFEAGVARVNITPPTPFWMSGYAARKHASEGVIQELWAKALALRDPAGHRVVIVTTDLIGLPAAVSEAAAREARRRYRLDRAQILFNSSHTHCGPAVGQNLSVMFDFNAEDARRTAAYAERLVQLLVRVIGDALRDLAPADLATGHGSVGFAVNRRQATPAGFRIGVNSHGVVDHDVPVLKVTAPDGRLRGVLFGYACHNTTLGGDFYQINGDYAGFAQAALEQQHPNTVALFVMLCGGDQNPHPRGTVPLAQQHGEALAAEVHRVLGQRLKPVHPPIRTAFRMTRLDFAGHTRATFEQEAQGQDVYRQRRARLMLEAYHRGRPIRSVPYPVQAVRFHDDLVFLALGGEVVIDYVLRAKRAFATEDLVVAGYCNDVMCYIPSRRVLKEGGYEAVDSMIYYGKPGPFTENVEETVFRAVDRVMKRVGARPSAR